MTTYKHKVLTLSFRFLILVVSGFALVGCGAPAPANPLIPINLSDTDKTFAFRFLWFDSDRPDDVFVSRDSGLYGSKDGGRKWDPLDLANNDTMLGACAGLFGIAGIHPLNVLVIYKISDLMLLASVDGVGVASINTETCKVHNFDMPLALSSYMNAESQIYLGTIKGQIVHIGSELNSDEPSQVFGSDDRVVSVTNGPSDELYVLSSRGDIKMRSSDTLTWTTTSLGFNPSSANSMAYNHTNQKWYLATETTLYRQTPDNKWERLKEFPDPISNIVIDPNIPRNLFVISRMEIWRSTNFGTSWDLVLSEPEPTTSTPSIIPQSTTQTSTPAPLILTPTPTSTITPTPLPTPTVTASLTPTVSPSPSPTPIPFGFYCIFLKSDQPIDIDRQVRMQIVVSIVDSPEKPPEYERHLGCGNLRISSNLFLRIRGGKWVDGDDMDMPKSITQKNDGVWEADMKFEHTPVDLLIQISPTGRDEWQDLPHDQLDVRETLTSRYGTELIAAMAGALIGVIGVFVSGLFGLFKQRV